MKFLHAADIHLDSPLAGLAARSDLPGELIRNATRRAFAAMVDLAIAEDVAFVVIAGDLYDGDWKDFSTGLFFAEQMRRLGRPCFLLRGNHDAKSVITRSLKAPGNVHEFSARTCETVALPDLGIALHGHSFPNRAVPEDLSACYKDPVRGLLNIGVLHTSAEDPGEHETYAPCQVGALQLKGYGYWALGHIHARRVLCERPWVVFPGNLQGRHAKETGAKGCSIVHVEDGEVRAVEHRAVDVLRWAALEVDAEAGDILTLQDRLAEAARAAVAEAGDLPVLARVTLRGATPLHAALLADAEQLAAECRNAALAAGGTLWVEALKLRTRPARTAEEGALRPLREAFAAALDEPARMTGLLQEFESLRRKLPSHAQEGLDLPADEAALRALAEDAWAEAARAIAEAEAP
ncbi:metallophosphoesterase family protein [Paracraurococcus lichenis]|uniref:DNA repair exonuclease n=1 Tax=Paracraurococcus lichenis TaxID=3064888 RepID=A0ABT9DUE0_9PROT|nr:DNA repair exonuclease [Paracraurococcus sp. LOR1-02]MDO9707517.1 DNA repair exonuclease [Paracraurococcus sp. LOR1-02]